MDPSENDFVCPVCDRPMRLATVLNHAPYQRTFVLQCRPCGLSITKTRRWRRQLRGFGWTQGNP
jgi:C4-type Zn-finger protein